MNEHEPASWRGALKKRYARRPDQFVGFLYSQRVRGFPVPAEPHLDDEATSAFVPLLEGSQGYLEFGSGGSTLLADRLGKPTITIESDRFFARSVARCLSQQSSVELVTVDIGLTGPWSYPLFDQPSSRNLAKWSRYSLMPFELLRAKDWFPDLVFIDGRFRRACALKTIQAVHQAGKPLTIFFDDYFPVGREHYRSVEKYLGSPKRAGRAAIFDVCPSRSTRPSAIEIADAVTDYR